MKAIAVFCGSRFGSHPEYNEAAEKLAAALSARKIDLVYGGGTVGLMGTVAKSVHNAGGKVVGIIPASLAPRELSGDPVNDDVVVVETMHERKQKMSDLSEAFISLPGGLGTLDETVEMACWSQLGIHRKLVGLVNVRGYYDGFMSFLDSAIEAGFIDAESRDIFVVDSDPENLVKRMLENQCPESRINWHAKA